MRLTTRQLIEELALHQQDHLSSRPAAAAVKVVARRHGIETETVTRVIDAYRRAIHPSQPIETPDPLMPRKLGGRDSNPRYRDQNPMSYQLDDPPQALPAG
jgi:hypothetical protein